ncbi:MAG TPA: hypothetical protein VIA06_23570 [Candidatus Dormibacteraeota bacterium]|jgi:ribosomal protein L24E|nr:hypothetical protein [Candidatus Dormibacteraeota bacterium]
MSRRALMRLMLPLVLLPLLIAACGGNSMAGMPGMGKSGSGGKMNMSGLPSWAGQLKVHILSPSNGATVTGNELPLHLSFSGYTPDCLLAGSPVKPGTGHFHVYLDGKLVDMFCSPDVDVSMQNVTPGPHKIRVVPALNDHQLVTENEVTIGFTYSPTSPLPVIGPAASGATPSITITSPASGSTVAGVFDMTVQVTNFQLSCPLQGKGAISGYGDWVLNLDTLHGAMNGMATMARISCSATIQLSTAAMSPGQHAFIAYLANSVGATRVPLVSSQIDLQVKR